MYNPIVIRMVKKNSKTTVNYSAKEDMNNGNGKYISCKFLLVLGASYEFILGMRFKIRTDATLRPGKGMAIFGNSLTTIKCTTNTGKPITIAALISIIVSREGSLSLLDDNDEYKDLFPQDED